MNERFTPASWAGDITAMGFLAASLALIRMRDEDEFRPAVSARLPSDPPYRRPGVIGRDGGI